MVYLNSIATYLPDKILTNDEIARNFPEWSVDKISRKTGIYGRHIAAENETAGDLAFAAAECLFAEQDVDRSSIDFVLLCTQSPDYFLPTTACILQHRLGLPITAGALDFNLGCSGYVYGLGLAKGLVATGQAKRVLLLTGETYSKHLNAADKSSITIFGDGASASILSAEAVGYRIDHFAYGTDGSRYDKLIVRAGAFRQPQSAGVAVSDEFGNVHSDSELYMDGPGIFHFTLDSVPSLVRDVLAANDINVEAVDRFVFHQANAFMLKFLRDKMKIPNHKFVLALQDCGNTVSATIPIALLESQSNAPFATGERIALVGFGVGLSLGACLITVI